MRYKLAAVSIATVISGALSGYFLLRENTGGDWTLFYGPGIFFGLTTGLVWLLSYKLRPLNILLWLVCSVLSWHVAIRIFLTMGDGLPLPAYIIAGTSGALGLAMGFWLCVARISRARALATIATGSLLGAVMFTVLQDGRFDPETLVLSFIIWQVGIGLVLNIGLSSPAGPVLSSPPRQK